MNHQYQALFVGYETLEEWLPSIDNTRPVFVNLIAETVSQGSSGIDIDRLVIVISQADTDGSLVYYCRLLVAQVRYMGGQPFDNDRDIRMKQARSALKIVEDWLVENGLRVLHGLIATPKDMLFLDGWASFLEFDLAKQEYTRKSMKKAKLRKRNKPMI